MSVLYIELFMLGRGGMLTCVVGFEMGRVVFTWVDWGKFVVACILRQTGASCSSNSDKELCYSQYR